MTWFLLRAGLVPRALAAWGVAGYAIHLTGAIAEILGIHVGLMLSGFASLTLAAGMAALYVWQERRLKLRRRGLLRIRVPPLDALDRLAARSVVAGLALLALGIGAGASRFQRGDLDAAMVVTIAILAVYASLLVLRHEGWRGRRAALLNLAGFALVAVVLPITHFAS